MIAANRTAGDVHAIDWLETGLCRPRGETNSAAHKRADELEEIEGSRSWQLQTDRHCRELGMDWASAWRIARERLQEYRRRGKCGDALFQRLLPYPNRVKQIHSCSADVQLIPQNDDTVLFPANIPTPVATSRIAV